ncbi:MAG: energy-coupling factor transporter ATPase [Clostridia bacterium]|nr:energy-coupling factor transporter ATPase [Clostridia bacterium]
MGIIDINNVSFSYKTDDGTALGVKNVTLSVEEGEFFVLLGHNGCGKSTLAKLINGFLSPDEGTITVDGVLSTDEERIFDLRSTVGMVFQNPDNQMVASIIEDDIAFGCENLGISPEEIRERVEWALKSVNMYDRKDGTPFKLSGGQKQRIAIASILAMKPKVLVLDESTSMLDPEGRKEVLDVVRSLNKNDGITVILITHYMDEALSADRVCVMNSGEIVGLGTPKDIFGQPEAINANKLELPIPTYIACGLRDSGIDLGTPLSDEELVEAICRLA